MGFQLKPTSLLGLGGIEGFFLELKDRITPHVNFFQEARSKCENEVRKAGERKDVVCARVVCKKVVCDNVVCERVVCDNVVCVRVVCDNVVCDNVVSVSVVCDNVVCVQEVRVKELCVCAAMLCV